MLKNKSLLGIFLAVALVTAQVIAAQAASSGQTVIATDTPTATADPCVATSSTSTGGTTSGGTSSTTSTGGTTTGGTSSTTSMNPVAEALCNAFGVDAFALNQQGFGYGEIAQACWMAKELNTLNNTTSFSCFQILQDKMNGNYEDLGLNGVSNWGQLKKAVLLDNFGNEGHQSLGQVMGHGGGLNNNHANGHGHGNNP